MLYFIGVIVLIILFILFSNFVSGYKLDKIFNPIIVNGSDTISSLKTMPFSSNKIIRSEDKRTGIEFTYTTWLKIDDNLDDNFYYNLFLKGGYISDSIKPSQCPGVWIKRIIDNTVKEVQIIINFDTFLPKNDDIECKDADKECSNINHCTNNNMYESSCNSIPDKSDCVKNKECKYNENDNPKCTSSCSNKTKETIILHNIPYNKWFHLAIILRNKEVDVYLNGNLYNTFKLDGVVKQNHQDLQFGYTDNINKKGLSNSVVSDFRYFNYAIPYYRLDNLLNNSKNNLNVPVKKDISFKPYLNRKYWTEENTRQDIYEQEIYD